MGRPPDARTGTLSACGPLQRLGTSFLSCSPCLGTATRWKDLSNRGGPGFRRGHGKGADVSEFRTGLADGLYDHRSATRQAAVRKSPPGSRPWLFTLPERPDDLGDSS